MSTKQYDKDFKLSAVQYYYQHQELGLEKCAKNLGIGIASLRRWREQFSDTGKIKSRGTGNYASEEQKEIARLKRELQSATDALDVLKKAISILGK